MNGANPAGARSVFFRNADRCGRTGAAVDAALDVGISKFCALLRAIPAAVRGEEQGDANHFQLKVKILAVGCTASGRPRSSTL